jgi:hypothetical protein
LSDAETDRIRGANPFPDELPAPPIDNVLRRLGKEPAAVTATRRRVRRPDTGGVITTVSSAIAVLAIGALGHHPRASRVSPLTRPSTQRVVAGGCGATKLYRGQPPAWTAPAFSDNSQGPLAWPFAIGDRGTVVAVMFGFPLRAGDPTNPADKVLWIMRLARHGSPLEISARPLHAGAPVIRHSWPADSGPGEIYPSYVNVPTRGCWRLTLRWARHTDRIDLLYKA